MIVGGEPLLDLDYSEDSQADVDLNVVMTEDGLYVDVQATAERVPFSREDPDELLALATAGTTDSRRAGSRGRSRTCLTSRPGRSSSASRPRPRWAVVIGIERELREREAGFRTHMLVSVGAALFTLVSAYAWTDFAFRRRAASRSIPRA